MPGRAKGTCYPVVDHPPLWYWLETDVKTCHWFHKRFLPYTLSNYHFLSRVIISFWVENLAFYLNRHLLMSNPKIYLLCFQIVWLGVASVFGAQWKRMLKGNFLQCALRMFGEVSSCTDCTCECTSRTRGTGMLEVTLERTISHYSEPLPTLPGGWEALLANSCLTLVYGWTELCPLISREAVGGPFWYLRIIPHLLINVKAGGLKFQNINWVFHRSVFEPNLTIVFWLLKMLSISCTRVFGKPGMVLPVLVSLGKCIKTFWASVCGVNILFLL